MNNRCKLVKSWNQKGMATFSLAKQLHIGYNSTERQAPTLAEAINLIAV
jgi:hypothetical protein